MHIRGWLLFVTIVVAVASSGSSDSGEELSKYSNSAKEIEKGKKALKMKNSKKYLKKKTKNLRKRGKKCSGKRRKEIKSKQNRKKLRRSKTKDPPTSCIKNMSIAMNVWRLVIPTFQRQMRSINFMSNVIQSKGNISRAFFRNLWGPWRNEWIGCNIGLNWSRLSQEKDRFYSKLTDPNRIWYWLKD